MFVAIFILLTLAGLACHLLAMRLLAWRGVTTRRTRFGLALLFDTTDEDGTTVRMLNVNGAFQSVGYVDEALSCELACEYQRLQARIVEGLPRLRHAAVIGGGGFSFPKWLVTHLPPVRVSCIEIDPAIIEIARESFGLAEVEQRLAGTGRLEVVCGDGWAWLREREEGAESATRTEGSAGGGAGCATDTAGSEGMADGDAWRKTNTGGKPALDLIVNEAFTGKRPLGPLTGPEGARLVHECLTEGGVYLATLRLPLEGRRSRPLHETCRAFAAEFAHVWLVPEEGIEAHKPGNHTLVASDCDLVKAGVVELASATKVLL